MPVRPRSKSLLTAALTALVTAGGVVAAAPAMAAGLTFTGLPAGMTQTLYATFPTPAPLIAGGLAFAPGGDLLVGECHGASGKLHRISAATTTSVHGSSVHSDRVIQSTIGCGLANGPGGTVWSNTAHGVVQVNPDTGAILATGPATPAGNALGIAYDQVRGRFVYAAATGLAWVSADLKTSGMLTPPEVIDQYDGVYIDPTGTDVFAADGQGLDIRSASTGARVQWVLGPGATNLNTDGVAFHAAGGYVVTNDTDGTIRKYVFPGGDYTKAPTISLLASGGSRGDLTQVGADGCLYVTQKTTKYDDGTTSPDQSIVQLCGGFTPPPVAPPVPPVPPVAPVTPAPGLVALGDGYAAGEGLGGYVPASASASPHNACHRSAGAYPWSLATALSLTSPAVVACSHATLADLRAPNHEGNLAASGGSAEPAQLNAVGSTTSLVTVGIGAADVGLDALVAQCLTVATPVQADGWGTQAGHDGTDRRTTSDHRAVSDHHAAADHSDASGRSDASGHHGGDQPDARQHHGDQRHGDQQAATGCAGGTALEASVTAALSRLAASTTGVPGVLADVRSKAPAARIVVTGYPLLFGASSCASSCAVGRLTVEDGTTRDVSVSAADAQWLDSVVTRLDAVLRQAATGPGVVYADPTTSFGGHGLCAGDRSWLLPVTGSMTSAGAVTLDASALHPTATGQARGYLRVVKAAASA